MSTILPGQKDSLLPNPDQIPANERSMPSTGRCLVSTAASLAHGDEPLWAQLAKPVFEPGSAAMAHGTHGQQRAAPHSGQSDGGMTDLECAARFWYRADLRLVSVRRPRCIAPSRWPGCARAH